MSDPTTVSDIARELTSRFGVAIRPRDITDLYYIRILDDETCPIVGGRRLIPRSYLPAIVDAMRARGMIPAGTGEETT